MRANEFINEGISDWFNKVTGRTELVKQRKIQDTFVKNFAAKLKTYLRAGGATGVTNLDQFMKSYMARNKWQIPKQYETPLFNIMQNVKDNKYSNSSVNQLGNLVYQIALTDTGVTEPSTNISGNNYNHIKYNKKTPIATLPNQSDIQPTSATQAPSVKYNINTPSKPTTKLPNYSVPNIGNNDGYNIQGNTTINAPTGLPTQPNIPKPSVKLPSYSMNLNPSTQANTTTATQNKPSVLKPGVYRQQAQSQYKAQPQNYKATVAQRNAAARERAKAAQIDRDRARLASGSNE